MVSGYMSKAFLMVSDQVPGIHLWSFKNLGQLWSFSSCWQFMVIPDLRMI